MLVVMSWLELCTSYSSSCHHSPPPSSLAPTSCAGGRHNMPRSWQVEFWLFDLESGVRVTCDVRYLCANFSLSRALCSRLRPDARDRQRDVRQISDVHHRLMPSTLWGQGHNKIQNVDIPESGTSLHGLSWKMTVKQGHGTLWRTIRTP